MKKLVLQLPGSADTFTIESVMRKVLTIHPEGGTFHVLLDNYHGKIVLKKFLTSFNNTNKNYGPMMFYNTSAEQKLYKRTLPEDLLPMEPWNFAIVDETQTVVLTGRIIFDIFKDII